MDPDCKSGFDLHKSQYRKKESSPTPERADILPKLLSLCCICGNDVGPGSNGEQAARNQALFSGEHSGNPPAEEWR